MALDPDDIFPPPQVNDVPLRGMTSDQVIDLLRKTKGAIRLSVVRL